MGTLLADLGVYELPLPALIRPSKITLPSFLMNVAKAAIAEIGSQRSSPATGHKQTSASLVESIC